MLTKSFGKLGWPVSAVGLGAWNIGNQWGESRRGHGVADGAGGLRRRHDAV